MEFIFIILFILLNKQIAQPYKYIFIGSLNFLRLNNPANLYTGIQKQIESDISESKLAQIGYNFGKYLLRKGFQVSNNGKIIVFTENDENDKKLSKELIRGIQMGLYKKRINLSQNNIVKEQLLTNEEIKKDLNGNKLIELDDPAIKINLMEKIFDKKNIKEQYQILSRKQDEIYNNNIIIKDFHQLIKSGQFVTQKMNLLLLDDNKNIYTNQIDKKQINQLKSLLFYLNGKTSEEHVQAHLKHFFQLDQEGVKLITSLFLYLYIMFLLNYQNYFESLDIFLAGGIVGTSLNEIYAYIKDYVKYNKWSNILIHLLVRLEELGLIKNNPQSMQNCQIKRILIMKILKQIIGMAKEGKLKKQLIGIITMSGIEFDILINQLGYLDFSQILNKIKKKEYDENKTIISQPGDYLGFEIFGKIDERKKLQGLILKIKYKQKELPILIDNFSYLQEIQELKEMLEEDPYLKKQFKIKIDGLKEEKQIQQIQKTESLDRII